MNKEQMMVELGSIGEEVVADLYRRQGCEVSLSENKYDSVKDMLIDGQTCEVKTQMPYFLKKMFTIKVDQYFKCMKFTLPFNSKIKASSIWMKVKVPSPKTYTT